MGFRGTAVEFNQQLLIKTLKIERESEYIPFSLHIFDSLASTNQKLWALLEQGAPSLSVVIATQQTAGRGQWGRQWLSAAGGLYLSVAIVSKLEAANSYQLTLATAWGIAAQLQECGINAGIKWPNDLVLEGRKLGGILTETKINKGQITQAVIGVGINWANPVPETGINLLSWQANHCSAITGLEILAARVLLGIETGLDYLEQQGIDNLLSCYLNLLTNLGDRVYIDNLLGTVVGVTSQGNLRLKMATSNTKEAQAQEIAVPPGAISLGYRK
jgi:BirA family biotin operon repressor/biotin-[acetyl-CoA-carboxylase] ligase